MFVFLQKCVGKGRFLLDFSESFLCSKMIYRKKIKKNLLWSTISCTGVQYTCSCMPVYYTARTSLITHDDTDAHQ